MKALEKRDYYINLFDFYEDILTEKQKLYFKEYYFEDYSLSEIANNHNISRSGVYDQIQTVHQLLDKYEDNLELFKKHLQRLEIYEKYGKTDNELVQELIQKLKGIE